MKFLISPSKTQKMNHPIDNTHQTLMHIHIDTLETFISSLDVDTYSKATKLDPNKASAILHSMVNPTVSGKAIESYTGLVYKQLQLTTYSEEQTKYMYDKVRILSARYGILRADDYIRPYRLDFNMKFHNTNLLKHWRKHIKSYLNDHKKDEVYISLASKEFNDLFDHNDIVYLDFIVIKDGIHKRQSTMMKQIRGQFLNQIILNEINDLPSLLLLQVNGFSYQSDLSTDTVLVFAKTE